MNIQLNSRRNSALKKSTIMENLVQGVDDSNDKDETSENKLKGDVTIKNRRRPRSYQTGKSKSHTQVVRELIQTQMNYLNRTWKNDDNRTCDASSKREKRQVIINGYVEQESKEI